jgi:HJR/Mrr/RecB family endonuclease
MTETVETLIQQGNRAFLAGRQTDAMLYYLDAMKKSDALESILKFLRKYKDNLYENQQMLQKLLNVKYKIKIIPNAIPIFLKHVKNQMEEIEAKKAYERFKKLMLSKHPKTVEQIIDIFLDEFENPSSKEKELLLKIFKELGLNYSLYEIDQFCHHRVNARALTWFEHSLEWEKPKTFTDIDAMTGFEFEDFIVDLFTKLGYVVEKKKRAHEQGLDLLILKHGERIAVQVKHYKKSVGNRAVQEVNAARTYYRCQRAIVVANSVFTKPAKQLAARCNVELWNRQILKEKMKKIM